MSNSNISTDTPEYDRLVQRQKDGNFQIRSIFPGDGPVTREEICREINRSLDAIEDGNYEETTRDDLD